MPRALTAVVVVMSWTLALQASTANGQFGACCTDFGCFISPYPGNCGLGPYFAVYQGDGTTCDRDFCGACCMPDNSCVELTIPGFCDSQGGMYQGDATDCSGATCAGARAGDVCRLPVSVGPCEGAFPRFSYDLCTGQCEQFTYGGCEGNANNFLTLAECGATCPPAGDICFLPNEVGPCDGVCPRFFYNACTAQCEPFTYGCCDGNANNFLTLAECETACPAAAAIPIPTVSQWGMLVMTLLVVAAGTHVVRRGQRQSAIAHSVRRFHLASPLVGDARLRENGTCSS